VTGDCPAVLIIRGERYPCQVPMPHRIAHHNADADAYWHSGALRTNGDQP
jgi:hypothetical protein